MHNVEYSNGLDLRCYDRSGQNRGKWKSNSMLLALGTIK